MLSELYRTVFWKVKGKPLDFTFRVSAEPEVRPGFRAKEGRHGLGPDVRGTAIAGRGAAGCKAGRGWALRELALLSGLPSHFPRFSERALGRSTP